MKEKKFLILKNICGLSDDLPNAVFVYTRELHLNKIFTEKMVENLKKEKNGVISFDEYRKMESSIIYTKKVAMERFGYAESALLPTKVIIEKICAEFLGEKVREIRSVESPMRYNKPWYVIELDRGLYVFQPK